MKRLALIAAAIAALAAATPAVAAPVFVINGFGWGHGIGLSQYGAAGLANNGSKYPEILAHYYRATTLGPVETSSMRVLVLAPSGAFKLSSDSPFSVQGAEGSSVQLPAGTASVSKSLVITIGGETHDLAAPLTFLPGATPLQVAGQPYRGKLNVHDTSDGILVVNELPLEEYLYGVVPREMPASWATEALKSQAVAARSYALATRKTSGVFDAYDDTRSQVYGGLEAEDARTTSAIEATAGQVVLYKGSVATTFFSATSGGRTAAIEDVWRDAKPQAYLRSVPDPTDSISPYYRWGPIVLSRKQLQRQVKGIGPRGIRDVTTTTNASGRVDLFVMVGKRGQAAIDGSAARTALGLRSSGFSVGVVDLAEARQSVAFRQKLAIRGLARNVRDAWFEAKSGRTWERVRAVEPDANGEVRLRVRPKSSTTYRLMSSELAGSGVRAPQTRVLVVARVKLERKGRRAFGGVVRPKQAGTSVTLERLGKRGWRRVARSKTNESGRYGFRLRKRPAGAFRVIASPGSGGVGAGVSATVSAP